VAQGENIARMDQEDKREGFLRRIRPHAEWEGIRWGWDLLRTLLIPSIYLGIEKLRRQDIDWTGLAILLVLCFLVGFLLFPSKRSRPKQLSGGENDLIIPQSKVEQVLGPIFEDVKGAGAQAAMLWTFAGWSRDLIQILEEVWDHWNYAGENLIHPLDARIDKLDFSKDKAHQLSSERRDFMVEYVAHRRRIRADFPGFLSFVTTSAYPSDIEYRRVLNGLRSHAEKLEEEADKLWKAESPNPSLHER
jgi:hypothetical protein